MHIKLSKGAILPSYQTSGAAGMDLHALLPEPLTMAPGQRRCVPTGVFVAIPEGYEGHIRPRSGLALRHGVTTLSGTIDSDYRGELAANIINLGDEDFVIRSGDRIAQIVFSPIVRLSLEQVEELDSTPRGEGGFGSTGV